MSSRSMIYLFLSCFVFLTPGFVFSNTNCPDAWIAYKGSCYLFAHGQKVTFTEAEHFCEQHASHLVHIENVHENNFLQQFITYFESNYWWIGLTDTVVEGEWQWIDTNSDATFLVWGTGEPDNTQVEEDCAIISRTKQFKWADVGCSATFQPICELNVSADNEIIG